MEFDLSPCGTDIYNFYIESFDKTLTITMARLDVIKLAMSLLSGVGCTVGEVEHMAYIQDFERRQKEFTSNLPQDPASPPPAQPASSQ